ncbi:hypothetical protein D6D17_07945 [Aureobasidium pullulans]|nr:hypothetical protein D6D17_07945 [Aureobasidium pullulans]
MTAPMVVAGGSLTQRLEIREVFEHLSDQEKLYAHHLSRAAWYGTRVILRQVSPEAEDIFNLILELHQSCSGAWEALIDSCDISKSDLEDFLEYAALFLANIGNYYSEGDQKFTPALTEPTLRKLGKASTRSQALLENVAAAMVSTRPASLGFPGSNAQSNYYPGPEILSQQEIFEVTKAMESRSIEPENTRILKYVQDGHNVFEVLQGSTETGSTEFPSQINGEEVMIRVQKGDYAEVLKNVCESLSAASNYAATESQRATIYDYITSFQTGSLDAYRESQKKWVKEKEPVIENIFGFVEQYHDPQGVRAEFQGLVAIADPDETAIFKRFVQEAPTFLRMLPWALGTTENNGKGPFEKTSFEAPEFTSIHSMFTKLCTTKIAANRFSLDLLLHNHLRRHQSPKCNYHSRRHIPLVADIFHKYNDIRETVGFKNVIIANRMRANVEGMSAGSLVSESDAESFGRCRHRVRSVSTAVHELLGHGAGKLLTEYSQGGANFDTKKPPVDPTTGNAITTWYRPGQTWTTVFEGLATSIEECRACLVAAYLMDVPELTKMFGYADTSEVTAKELLYNTYILLAVEGVEALQHYSIENKGSFGILKQLLREGNGCISIKYDSQKPAVTVEIDRSKIIPFGKEALGAMLLKIHVYRCTANVEACKPYYEDLTAVEADHEKWRAVIVGRPEPRRKFVQSNTILQHGKVSLQEYEATNVGMIQSWAERGV